MGNYVYYWDSANKKKTYGGKRGGTTSKFTPKEAGQEMQANPNEAGTEVGFKGSRSKNYVFEDEKHGTHGFTAVSYQDALRQAKALGFTAGDYVGVDGKKRRGKRGK